MTLKERERAIYCLEQDIENGIGMDRTVDVTDLKRALTLIKELTEEIKELEADYDCVYEQAEADIRGNMADGGTSCHWCIAGHRREVVQQMQSMIKEECLAGGIYPAFVARVVENVGKKLLEDESNG